MASNKTEKNSKEKAELKARRKRFFKLVGRWCLIASLIGTVLLMFLPLGNTSTQTPAHTSWFYINDYSAVFSEQTELYIYENSKRLYELTGAQIVVAATPDTGTEALEAYANKLFNDWGVGSADEDNGVLILFTTGEAHVRMEVGYGMEGCLPDSRCGRILDDHAVTDMHAGNWNAAAINTWVATAKVVCAEYGLTYPESAVPEITEYTDGATMADASFPELVVKESGDTNFFVRIISAFIGFWVLMFLPAILIIGVLYIGEFSKGGGGSRGGGGSSGGGGATR